MGLLDNIRMALASLWANKMRAILTMLGIIIGIAAVIAIMTLGSSLTGSMTPRCVATARWRIGSRRSAGTRRRAA